MFFEFIEYTSRTSLEPELLSQLVCHILAYADMLFGWQLLNKRLELLNTVKTSSLIKTLPRILDMRFGACHTLLVVPLASTNTCTDIQPACGQCGQGQSSDDVACSMCGSHQTNPRCSVCRLPVKGKFPQREGPSSRAQIRGFAGLSRSCGQCLHITHVKCWQDQRSDTCGTGCGCRCSGLNPVLKNTSFVRSPTSYISGLL